MKHGYVNVRLAILLLLGSAGAGKTSAKHLFLGLPPPDIRRSTSLAEGAIRAISTQRAMVSDTYNFVWDLVSLKRLKQLIADAIKAGVPQENVVPSLEQLTRKLEDPNASTSLDTVNPNITQQPLEASTHTSTSGSSDKPSQVQASKHELENDIQQLIQASSGSRKLFEVDWVYLVDTGGQPSFREIKSLFLRSASAVAFVTKLNERLNHKPTIEWYDQDGKRFSSCSSPLTNQEIFRHSIRELRSRQTLSPDKTCPSIFVIGTHKDLEHTCKESRREKNATLLDMLQHDRENLAYYDIVGTPELIFPVNAKTPTEEDRKVAMQFRRAVVKSGGTRVKLPLPWFVLELYIQELSTILRRKILRTSECEEEGEKLHMNKEACEAALVYLDKINMFFYRPEYLRGLVFYGLQVILDKVSELIEYIARLQGKSQTEMQDAFPLSALRSLPSADRHVLEEMPRSEAVLPDPAEFCDREGINFCNNAIVTINILKKFPTHYVEGLFTPAEFLKLLNAFLVTAPVTEGSDQYVMPCLLREISLLELDKLRKLSRSSPASPLLIAFPDNWVPAGVFIILVTYLQTVGRWKLSLISGTYTPRCFHRNCVTFLLPTGHGGFVTLIDSFEYLEVHVHDASDTACWKACRQIRHDIFKGIEEAASRLHYGALLPQPAFHCPTRSRACRREYHMANVVDNELVCSVRGIKTGELSKRYKVWFPMGSPKDDPLERLLTTDDFPAVYSAVYDARIKWSILGTELGLSRTDVTNIRDENWGASDSNAKCLAIMLNKWLERRHSLAPSWRSLVRALKSRTVGEEGVACDIEQKYLQL